MPACAVEPGRRALAGARDGSGPWNTGGIFGTGLEEMVSLLSVPRSVAGLL